MRYDSFVKSPNIGFFLGGGGLEGGFIFSFSFRLKTHALTVIQTPKIEQGFRNIELDHKNTALR